MYFYYVNSYNHRYNCTSQNKHANRHVFVYSKTSANCMKLFFSLSFVQAHCLNDGIPLTQNICSFNLPNNYSSKVAFDIDTFNIVETTIDSSQMIRTAKKKFAISVCEFTMTCNYCIIVTFTSNRTAPRKWLTRQIPDAITFYIVSFFFFNFCSKTIVWRILSIMLTRKFKLRPKDFFGARFTVSFKLNPCLPAFWTGGFYQLASHGALAKNFVFDHFAATLSC